jgi:anti-sigma-K factor RskA
MPEQHLLTGVYALDALDDVERAGFERHLRSCPSCTAEVIEFREAAAALADRVAAEPPPRLRAAVLAEVARTRQVSPVERVHLRRPSLRRTLATAAAAAVIAGTAALGGVAWQSHESAQKAQVAAQQAAEQSTRLTEVLTDPARIEAVGTVTGGGTATVVAARGQAVLATTQLPALPDGRRYQVWLIKADKRILSAGLLGLQGGSGQSLVSGVSNGDAVAVSVEPAGGSKQPTTDPIVAVPIA